MYVPYFEVRLHYHRRFLVWGLEGLAEVAREAVRRARASERDPIALALIGSSYPTQPPSRAHRHPSNWATAAEIRQAHTRVRVPRRCEWR